MRVLDRPQMSQLSHKIVATPAFNMSSSSQKRIVLTCSRCVKQRTTKHALMFPCNQKQNALVVTQKTKSCLESCSPWEDLPRASWKEQCVDGESINNMWTALAEASRKPRLRDGGQFCRAIHWNSSAYDLAMNLRVKSATASPTPFAFAPPSGHQSSVSGMHATWISSKRVQCED